MIEWKSMYLPAIIVDKHRLKRVSRDQRVVYLINFDGYYFVMPAEAGIQEHPAETCTYAFWMLGLALLARNDVPRSPLTCVEMRY